jgi:NAD(P)H-hydrate epimerase
MKAIEQKAITAGVPSLLLMENAAMSLTGLIRKDGFNSVLVLCGKGNNGGDGLACARQLFALGTDVTVIFVGMPQRATEDCLTNLKAAKALNIPIIYFDKDLDDISELKPYFDGCELIVDALVGTGLSSALHEPLASIVRAVNASGKPIYSADCPTGVSTDSGEDYGNAVLARKTVTFHLPKTGLLLYPACEHTGELIIGNISLPADNITSTRVLSEVEARELMPRRASRSDKSTYGRLFAFVGCDGMTGAAVLSLKSAYRAGVGLVYANTTSHCAHVIQNNLPEAVVTTVADTDGYINSSAALTDLKRATAVLIGCGLGNNSITHDFIRDILGKITSPLLLDADGLNVIAADEKLKTALPADTIITPHPKEMSRLTGLEVDEILKNPIGTATDFAKKYNVITVLKDARTVIAAPDGRVTINITGTPAMSKGGSGDCLAGIIGALVAQGVDCYNAAALGCYISGKAGELAHKNLSAYGVLATDMIDCIAKVFCV